MDETGPDETTASPTPPPPPVAKDDAETPKWWKRSVPLWATILIALLCIGLGVASAGGDDTQDVAAAADLEGELASQKSELADSEDRIKELTKERDRLERRLDKATASTTTTTMATTTTISTTTMPPTTSPPTTADPFGGETASQSSARRKAADYLDLSGFSRSGLIAQLEYEGFSTADATYGTDAQNADWNHQAARKAEDYMELSGFSRSGMIEQLMYERFTRPQAEYGADSVGL